MKIRTILEQTTPLTVEIERNINGQKMAILVRGVLDDSVVEGRKTFVPWHAENKATGEQIDLTELTDEELNQAVQLAGQ